MRSNCAACSLRSRMLFANIDIEAAAPILEPIYHVWHEPGEFIYRQGEASGAIYSIRRGIVKLSILSTEGEVRIVRLVGPGATIGLEALLEKPYEHTAETLRPADICHLPVRVIKQLSDEQPVLFDGLMHHWHQSVLQADKHILQLSTGPIRNRVINLLNAIHDLCEQGNTSFLLPSNQDCSTFVAARVETVSRIIAELKRTGFLTRNEAGDWAVARIKTA